MMTSWSLNCSSTSCQSGVGGSSGRAVSCHQCGFLMRDLVLMYSTIAPILGCRTLHLRVGQSLVLRDAEMLHGLLRGRKVCGFHFNTLISYAEIQRLPAIVHVDYISILASKSPEHRILLSNE